MSQEITIDGISIAPDVLETIVARAVEKVEGVVCVGIKGLQSNLAAILLSRSLVVTPGVVAEVDGDELALTIHLTAFFGYPFKKLAAEVREVAAQAIDAQVGVGVSKVDVFIDNIVFPRE